MTAGAPEPVTDAEVVGYLGRYLAEQGLPATGITPGTGLEELGLDSLHLAELLLGARQELADAGRLPEDATLSTLPTLHTVADLSDLIRGLAAAGS